MAFPETPILNLSAQRSPNDVGTGLSGWRGACATLGVGRIPGPSGTYGSLLAILPCPWLPDTHYPWILAVCSALATWGCVALSRRLPPAADPSSFVLDEAAGVWIAALWPHRPDLSHLLGAFLAFRLFDITKPSPLRRLEHVRGGFGIVLDDLGAGVYALAVMIAVSFLRVSV